MADTAVARRYARAAFEVASTNNSMDVWLRDLGVIADRLGQPEVAGALASVRMPFEQKRQIVERVLEDLVSPLALNLALLLVQRGRIPLIDVITAEFRSLVNEARGLAVADVTTAVPLSSSDEQRVAAQLAQLTGKQIQLRTKVDPAIMGGLIARIGDKVLDGSTRSRLVALRQRLAG